ncbi:hypothetical protein J9303_02540 [Bacillaceae bacterium Marseille-Q3522]|nr:hypothetical protein [Bacillaceae bacterium Marseille-Q3522]
MSLKSVEMQVALPRTQEIGKIQEQLQQRGQIMQAHANESVEKDVVKKRTSVTKEEETKEAKWEHNQSSRHRQQEHEQKKQKSRQIARNHYENHPYKGHKIDFSG